MATSNKNLSDYNYEDVPSARDMKFGIAVAEWNENITNSLFNGALNTLINYGCNEKNIIRFRQMSRQTKFTISGIKISIGGYTSARLVFWTAFRAPSTDFARR